MSPRNMRLIALVTFMFGVALMAYPYISDYFSKQELAEVMDRQDERVYQENDEDSSYVDRELNRAYEYNESLRKGVSVITDPFDPNREVVTSEDYLRCLNALDDGVMGSIDIPCIKAKLPIYHTVNSDVLQKGVGHLEATSLPCGGESSHSVLTGHTGLTSISIFDRLEEVSVDDYFVINILGQDIAYRVFDIETVLPSETQSLGITNGKDLCTLVTCTPYGINSHRLLVHGERIDVPEAYSSEKVIDNTQIYKENDSLVVYSLTGIAIGLGILSSYMFFNRRHKASTIK